MNRARIQATDNNPVHGALRGAFVAIALAALATGARAEGGTTRIISCKDVKGRTIVVDRRSNECAPTVDTTELNSDGSKKGVLPPALTIAEREAEETRVHDLAMKEAEVKAVATHNKLLLKTFPNEAAHRKARERDLAQLRATMTNYETQLAALAVKRKPLTDDAEFYINKPLPLKLKQALDDNDATAGSVRDLFQKAQDEANRINAKYDDELAHLVKLWGTGASPVASPGTAPTTSTDSRLASRSSK